MAEDVLDAIDPDDLDDDYEPPHHLDSPWTRSLGNGRRQQGNVCVPRRKTLLRILNHEIKI